jgi:DNA-binding XRE family transcriptional regulator
MHLIEQIETYRPSLTEAYEALGRRYSVKARTIMSWRNGDRLPSIEIARVIIRKNKGKMDYNDIYAPYRGRR